jgi:hypothetical protein
LVKVRAPSQASGTFQELLGPFSGGRSYAEHMGVGRQFVAHLAGPSTSIGASTTQEAVTDATRAKLLVNVLATTHDGTRCALDVAKRLIGGLDAQVVLLLPRLALLSGGFDPASQERTSLVDEHRRLAAEVGVHVKVLFCLCHRYDDIVHQMLGRSSLLIVGGKTRTWWPTREERLVSRLAAEGYPVVFAQVGAAHALSAVVDTARS